jgi:hypothetical protein
MKQGRCGSQFSGTPRVIDTFITINEGDQIIRISYADGTSGYTFKILSLKPSDDSYGSVVYKLQPDGQGFHTLIVDKDPLRNFIFLIRADNNCLIFADLD